MVLNLISFVSLRKLYLNYKSGLNIKRNTKENNKYSKQYTTLGYGVLIGIVITIVIILLCSYIINKYNNYKVKQKNDYKSINQITKLSSNLKPKNNYDFYRLLSSEHINSNNQLKNNHLSSKVLKKSINNHYTLELGEFNSLIAADELKAKLALYGFETNIKLKPNPIETKHNKFIVVVGPFTTKKNAIAKKEKLILYGFKNIIIRNL